MHEGHIWPTAYNALAFTFAEGSALDTDMLAFAPDYESKWYMTQKHWCERSIVVARY